MQSHSNRKINSQEKQTVRNEPQSGSEWSEDESNDLEDEFFLPANFRERREELLSKNLTEYFESKVFSHLHYIETLIYVILFYIYIYIGSSHIHFTHCR